MNIFYGRSCNELTEEQLESLGELGDYESPAECLDTINSCGVSLEDLLDSHPAFFAPEVLPVSPGDNVVFVKDDWYRVELRQAVNSIVDTESLFNDANWSLVCSIKNTKPPQYKDFETIWPKYTPGQSYDEGDIVFKIGGCGDSACAYIALADISDSEGINADWKKIFCLATNKYTCGNYKRKKTPEQGYRLVKVGTGQYDYVEHPVPYKKYLGKVFKDCGGRLSSTLIEEDILAVWFEGEREESNGESLPKTIYNIYGLVIPADGESPTQQFIISELLPENHTYQAYLNYRPAVNKLDDETVLLTWEYLESPSIEFQDKTFIRTGFVI